MNFKKIIDKQKELDKAIKNAHSLDIDHKNEMIIALYVEIGEFANEVQSFKYWKKQKNIILDNMLEEYADGLHFLMSFAIKYNCSDNIEALVLSKDINIQFLQMYKIVYKLSKKITTKTIEKSIAIYLGLAKILNLQDHEIEQAYLRKNKKNFERIKNNY